MHGQQIAAQTTWNASSLQITIEGEGMVRVIELSELADRGPFSVTVAAEANGGACSTNVELVVVDGPPAGGPGAGIPEPILVDDPGLSWRSRLSLVARKLTCDGAGERSTHGCCRTLCASGGWSAA